MSPSQTRLALSLFVMAPLLCSCQRNEPPTVIVTPGPAGEPGAPGATGAMGEAGKAGSNSTVIVAPPAASAASV